MDSVLKNRKMKRLKLQEVKREYCKVNSQIAIGVYWKVIHGMMHQDKAINV